MSEFENAVQETQSIKICRSCGAPLAEGVHFCSTCGTPVESTPRRLFCAVCGTELSAEEMYCHNCGAATSQKLDQTVQSNIASYNAAILSPPKPAAKIGIKDTSFFSFVALIACAIYSAYFAIRLVVDVSYARSFAELLYPYCVSTLVAALGFFVASITGIFIWKEKAKLRVLPVVFYTVASIAVVYIYYVYIIAKILVPTAAILLPHLVAILLATKVITTKGWSIGASIAAVCAAVIVPALCGYDLRMSFLAAVLAAPMFALSLSFTAKELKQASKVKRVLRAVFACILSVAVILAGIGYAIYSVWTYVDDYTGMNIEEAKEKCSRLDVNVLYQYSETLEKGIVIGQDIAGGSFVHKYTDIYLSVSKGPGVKLPNVSGMTFSEAKETIEALGARVSATYTYHSYVKKDLVISSSSNHVDEGGFVTLTVSLGEDPRITVPDVVGLTESTARSNLKDKGFDVSVVYVYDYCDAYDSSPKVTDQSLQGKQMPGTKITIWVSKPSISITQVNFDHNSVAGVDVDISFKNISDKTIKYVDFTAHFKNSVGDDVYCTIRQSSTRVLQYTGPLYSGSSDKAYWDAVIYNWNASRISFDKIQVTFMDGTTQTMYYGAYWH